MFGHIGWRIFVDWQLMKNWRKAGLHDAGRPGRLASVHMIEETPAAGCAIRINHTVESAQCIRRTRDVGNFKSSTLVDTEQGKRREATS